MNPEKDCDPLRQALRSARLIIWRSSLRDRVLWGFPVTPFVDVVAQSGQRWSLTETIGGWCWVRHDCLVEISGVLPRIGGSAR